ncbi:6-phosphogluconolactonase like protein [Verticillium longisporum]|uniref:6-phosphogluconolactonase like protein n=1 Tax=Verticillium longisporum TaxID=100787 RepID=A0A8I2ZPT5_VERLO|nr:6-phosphogluconolactonase like protein [Verticillium longisporum]KAG7135031.1 6-phosphogluconolactonase like protein [Verticillium longisporum]
MNLQLLTLASLVLGLSRPARGASKLIASHFSRSLYSLALSDTNELAIGSSVPSGNFWPSWLDLDAETSTLYVPDGAFWSAPNGLTTFTVEADGSLTPAEASIQAVTDGGEVHSTRYGGVDGKSFIAMAHYGTARIVTRALPLTPTSQPLQQVTFTIPAPGPNPRQDAPHPHAVFTDPTGAFLLTADLGSDRIHVFAIDAETGLLTQCPAGEAIPGDGPRHGVFWSPSNDTEASVLLTINELSNSVTSWEVTYEGGCLGLQQIESLSTLPDGVVPRMGAKAAEIRVRDNFVYASNRNDGSFGEKEDSIALYEIGLNGEGRAELQFVEISSAHSWFPRTFDINAAGDLVAVGGQTSAEVVVLERNITTGRLGAAVAAVRVGALGTANNEDGVSAVIWDE